MKDLRQIHTLLLTLLLSVVCLTWGCSDPPNNGGGGGGDDSAKRLAALRAMLTDDFINKFQSDHLKDALTEFRNDKKRDINDFFDKEVNMIIHKGKILHLLVVDKANYKDRERAVKAFLRAGADINRKNWLNETPLIVAAKNPKKADIITLLIQSGADRKAKIRENGAIALFHAAYRGDLENFKALLKAKDGSTDNFGINHYYTEGEEQMTVLRWAENGKKDLEESFEEPEDKEERLKKYDEIIALIENLLKPKPSSIG